jgi:hypothetical protein
MRSASNQKDLPGMTTVKGLDKIIEKGNQFQAMIEEFHGQQLSDPVVAGNYFSVQPDHGYHL